MNFYPPLSRIAGRYVVASRPLLGGMGAVYLCYDLAEGRPVALKTFRPEYLSDRDSRDRFLREGNTWVDLGRQPHIVHAYGVERIGDGQEVYLVLEQIAKEPGHTDASLRSWLTPGRPLPVADALLIALQIARGLKHASERVAGFVHRDLKPENVLVGADRLSGWAFNRVRVTDFGLAAVLAGTALPGMEGERDVRQTQLTHGLVGTPLYMAPEQWAGEPASAKTDMYALGLMLYEMLNGERAVNGRSLKELELAHRDGALRPWRAGVPASALATADRCLQLAAGERYGSWGEVEQALARAYVDVSGQAAPRTEALQALARDERVALGWARSALGASYLDLGKADVALGYFATARDVGVVEGDRRLESAGLNHLGLAYAALGDARRAIEYHEQQLVIDREIGDRRGEGVALGNLGVAYKNLGDARRAIEHHEKSLQIKREIGDRRGEGVDLCNLGIAYKNLGDARRAIDYYQQALVIDREVGDRRGEGVDLGNLGVAYRKLGDARRAIAYHEQALTIAREIGNRREEGNALGNLGAAYAELGDARRAIAYQEQALTVMREIGDRRGEGNTLGNLGLAYARLGNARQAIEYSEQALIVMREIGDATGVANAAFNMALRQQQQGNAARALPMAQEAARIWLQIGHAENAKRAQQLVAQLQGGAPPTTSSAPTSLAENAIQAAFEAFQTNNSTDELRQAVAQHHILIDPQFIAAIEHVIQTEVPLEDRPTFQQRLDSLRRIAAGQ